MLIGIGLFQMLAQVYTLMIMAFTVGVEQIAVFAVGCVLFWLFFYFVWIGINWMRWLWGAWDLIAGFCLLMWGWSNSNSIEIAVGSIIFIVGFILCFSPSIYFFAQHQREHVRWLEAVLTAGVCLLLVASIGTALLSFIALREDWRKDATSFAMEANHRIYQDRDFDWVQARVNDVTSRRQGPERLQNFFRENRERLGAVSAFEEPRSRIIIRVLWPLDLAGTVWVDSRANTSFGPVETHEIVEGRRGDWHLDHMWWEWVAQGK